MFNTNINQYPIVKFCIFAGRKKNLEILHSYIKLLLQQEIIHEYHIFDFTRNSSDKSYLFQSYQLLSSQFNNQIFIHNHESNQNLNQNQTNWSPFYSIISQHSFYNNSIIIKCDDDILFIDINGLKNAIQERIKDKKSFLIHSNCINNNISSFYQQHKFPSLTEKLNIYPTGGICGPIFENPILAYIMQYQFLNDVLKNLDLLYTYYLQDIYINTRISINFILLNGEDCKYFKNTSLNDEYELSSYYPEKLLRPNKILGNFITCHYSYSLQEKVMMKKNDILKLYHSLSLKYIERFKELKYEYKNESMNKVKINRLSKNKFYTKHYNKDKYSIFNDENKKKYLIMDYEDNQIKISENRKNTCYFNIQFIENDKIMIRLGIYYLNIYNLNHNYDFKNRNIFTKFFNQIDENRIQLIPKNGFYYFMFVKHQLYININPENNSILLEKEGKTLWNIKKHTSNKNIYVSRFSKNKKFYYKNLKNDEIYTNFYLGWSFENILEIITKKENE